MSKEFKLVPVKPTEEMKAEGCMSCQYVSDWDVELIYEAMLAAAPQPPALGGVPAGLDLQRIVTEALMGMIAAVTSTSPPANEPPPAFIQAGIDRAVSRISAHLTPLQAEIERLAYELNCAKGLANLTKGNLDEAKAGRDQLKARCDELEHRAADVVEGFDGEELPGAMTMRVRKLKAALSKPNGGERV